MRRFHLPLIIGAILNWLLLLLLFFFRSPYQQGQLAIKTVTLFLFLLALAVTFSLALFLFFSKKLLGLVPDERRATRVSLRQAFWLGVGVATLGLLKVWGVLNWLTATLTLLTLIAFEAALRR